MSISTIPICAGQVWVIWIFQPILQTLGELNYARWLSVEVFDFTPGAEQTARDSLAYLRKF